MAECSKKLVILTFFSVGWATALANPEPPIRFVENRNQWPAKIQYAATIPGGQLSLSGDGFHLQFLNQRELEAHHLHSHEPEGSSLQADRMISGVSAGIFFEGANCGLIGQPSDKLPAYYNFFQGSHSDQWASRVRAFGGVRYDDLYAGVDLHVYSKDEALKYDFVVAPMADPRQIQLAYYGVDKLAVLNNGDLEIKAAFTGWLEQRPVAYQLVNGRKVEVSCNYLLRHGKVTFEFPNGYDTCLELVIDPLLIFSTYSGSAADNWGSTATPGENGTLYSAGVTNHFIGTGTTFSGTFPATPGAFQTSYGGLYDVAILKYDSTGQRLLYASYLGGTQSESPHSLVVNANNELVVLGTTGSTNFPTTDNAFDRSFNGGTLAEHVVDYVLGSDIFVARISADGSQLLGSTYLGGSGNDGLNPSSSNLTANYGDQLRGDIITDESGAIYLSSVTSSNNFPAVSGFSNSYRGGMTDAVVVKFDASLSTVLWSNYLGGTGADASHSIKISPSGRIYVAGGTTSPDMFVAAGSYQPAFKGNVDGWIARLNATGAAIERFTFTGTTAFDQVYFIDVNQNEEVFAYGQTNGAFPTTPGVYKNANSGQFVQKFDAGLTTLIFSTVFGSGRGVPDISPTAFLVNDCNNIYLSGWGGSLNHELGFWNSSTTGLPTTADAIQRTTKGSDFYFIVLTDDASEFLYGTFLGGDKSSTHVDGGTSRFDKSGIVYHAVCSGCSAFNSVSAPTSDFPTTPGAWSRLNKSKNCNNAAFKFDLSSLRARIQTNNALLKSPGIRDVCMPDEIVFQNRSTGGQVYEWDLGDGTKITKIDTARITHLYEAPGRYTVKLKALDQGTCIGKDSTAVVIDVSTIHTEVSDDAEICFGSSVRLSATGGATYEWKTKDGSFTSSESGPLVSPEDTTEYFLTATSAKGCVQKDTVKISVVPGIQPDFSFDKVYDCIARPYVTVKNLTETKDGEMFVFDWGDGTQSELNEDQHHYQQDGYYQVKLVTQREFCVYEKQVQVPVFSVMVPNAITPADEGEAGSKNDAFQITFGNPPLTDPDMTIELKIYNRWGNLVYSSADYRGDWRGEGLENGVYYYELTIVGEATCKSWIHLIK